MIKIMTMTITNRKDKGEETAGIEKAEFNSLNSALVILEIYF